MTGTLPRRGAEKGHPDGARGAALLVALPLLLVVTMLGITGMRNTILQERMAANMRDRDLAFQAAEAALREGERRALFVANAPVGFRPNDGAAWEALFADPDAGWRTYSAGMGGVVAQPRFFVEELHEVPLEECPPDVVCDVEFGVLEPRALYRITARGVGGTREAVVILQSTLMG